MARLLADENFPLPTVNALRRLGHDLVTLAELGRAGRRMPDEDVLAVAVADGRAVLTLNRRHFIRLHQTHPAHAGIIVCTVDLDVAAQAGRIDEEIGRAAPLDGRLVRVNRPTR